MEQLKQTRSVQLEDMKITIRGLTESDLSTLLELTNKVGWKLNLQYLKDVYNCDPAAMTGAFDENGKLISHCMCTEFDSKNAYFSLYVTDEKYRKKGIGSELYRAAVAGKHNIILDCTTKMIPVYKSMGYKPTKFKTFAPMGIPSLDKLRQMQMDPSTDIVSLDDVDFNDVIQYYMKIHPFERQKFLRVWLNSPQVVTKCAITDDKITGYGIIRDSYDKNNKRIVGLYADTTEIARALLINLVECGTEEGNSVRLMIPDQQHSKDLVADIGIPATSENIFIEARMFLSENINVPLKKVYALANATNALC